MAGAAAVGYIAPVPSRISESSSNESETDTEMDVKIKATLQFTISGPSLEDALAEYDELTVEGLLREILDKAIACDAIKAQVLEGPNTLEDYDKATEVRPEG